MTGTTRSGRLPKSSSTIAATAFCAILLVGAPTAASAAIATPAIGTAVMVSDATAEVKYYVVRPAYKGEPEFLFEIAERFLKNGNRWPEIFELNKGRVQADGGALTDESVINAGWVLQLPLDATGKAVESGPLPTAAAAPAPSPPVPASGAEAETESSATMFWIIGAVTVMLGLVLLGYGVSLMRRRPEPVPTPGRPGRPPAPLPVPAPEPAPPRRAGWRGRGRNGDGEPRPRPFDAAASWTVDRALRSLAGLAIAAGRPLPAFYAVSLDADLLRLRLAGPDHDPPAPWTADEEGLTWMAPLRALQAVPLDDRIPAPSPRLVTLGLDGGTRVLIDLGQATGVIGVEGPAAGVRAMLQGWIAELGVGPWAEEVRVIVAGLEAAAETPGSGPPARVEHVAGTREALAAVGSHAVGWAGGGAVAGVVRGAGAPSPGAPGVLVLGGGARGAELEQVQALAGRPDAGWAVVFVGRVPAARWRFTLGSDGKLDTGVLGITVRVSGDPVPDLVPGRR